MIDIIAKYAMAILFYYKMRQKVITKCVRFFNVKCDSYYKIYWLLHNALIQCFQKNPSLLSTHVIGQPS